MKFSTRAIHTGNEPNLRDGGSGDVVVPIHQSTTFARKDVYKPTGGYEYSRTGNPTRAALEKNLASLETGKYGLAYASGLAATTNVLFLLKSGDHVISSDDVYGGTGRLFNRVFKDFGLEFSFVDMTDPKVVEKAIRKNTRMIWIESPTNPLMKIVPIKALTNISKRIKAISVVDNTFASPYFQQPLKLGADIALHSSTKYLGGHSDVVGGALITSDDEIHTRLKFLQNAVGAVQGPFDSWLVLRGIKTLAIRMARHEENATSIAKFLKSHKKVAKVYYPGLPTHPGHAIAKKQMSGFSGMLSFELKADLKHSIRFMESVKLFALAESLGAVESLIEHPASMTHASVPAEHRKTIGLSDGLIRLSVGIEDKEDLTQDLEEALENV